MLHRELETSLHHHEDEDRGRSRSKWGGDDGQLAPLRVYTDIDALSVLRIASDVSQEHERGSGHFAHARRRSARRNAAFRSRFREARSQRLARRYHPRARRLALALPAPLSTLKRFLHLQYISPLLTIAFV